MRNTTKKISEETTDLDKNLTVDGSDIETSSKYNGNSLETPKVSGEPIEIYNNNAETEAAFCNAERVTLVGSTIPAAIMSTHSSVAAL